MCRCLADDSDEYIKFLLICSKVHYMIMVHYMAIHYMILLVILKLFSSYNIIEIKRDHSPQLFFT